MSSVPLDRTPAPRKLPVGLPSVRTGQNLHSRIVAIRESVIKTDRWDCLLKGIGWLAGFIIALLLIAAAFILIPPHILALDSVAYVLLARYLANWLYILALAALGLTIIWRVIKAKTVCRQADL